ncbi:MAG: peptidylprolyl isomerase [Endomicrobium sp.]|jgi:parvulin-like peptidyl-prolyl isomerase|nr:peptidylprolyl isomerase [Endomicrobium sp.]
MKKVLFVAVLALAGLAACKDNGAVVAKVGSASITEDTLNRKLALTPPAYQNYVATPLGKKQFIDAIVREAIMVESAKQAGIAKRAEYSEALREFEENQKRQLEDYKDGLLIEAYLKEIHTGITASESDIEAYYNVNKESFDNPVEYTVKHILVSDQKDAQDAYAELENGAKFDDVARKYSQDSASAENGGLIGPFKKGDLVPEFEKVALELKNNEMSGIVETQYGYHIIFKVSEKSIPAITFEQAAPLIKRTIEKEKFDKWFEDRKKSLGVTVNYDSLQSPKDAPGSAAEVEIVEEAAVTDEEGGQK